MYTKKFTALTSEEIKMVNASALAKQFECTSAYIGKILKSPQEPKNEKAQNILQAAREIISTYKSYPTINQE